MKKMMHNKVCSKLILSGEYAVLFGAPAIISAIDIYTDVTISINENKTIIFHLINLALNEHSSLNDLENLHRNILENYKNFCAKKTDIKNVIEHPANIAKFVVADFLNFYKIKVDYGFTITLNSFVPINSGLGSSAAIIIGILKSLYNFFQITIQFTEIFNLGKKAESLQHGQSSGIDLAPIIYNCSVYYNKNNFIPLKIPKLPLYLINTGAPIITTGECVNYIKENFSKNSIWQKFTTIINNMYVAIQNNDNQKIHALIYNNHLLLKQINVVPDKVANFITKLYKFDISAKITGAGAISGDNAGIIIAFGENIEKMRAICENYQYEILSVNLL